MCVPKRNQDEEGLQSLEQSQKRPGNIQKSAPGRQLQNVLQKDWNHWWSPKFVESHIHNSHNSGGEHQEGKRRDKGS